MRAMWWCIAVAAAGCGRIGFDPAGAPSCEGLLFCDGFEDPALARWTGWLGDAANTARTEDRGYVGASLHIIGVPGAAVAARYADVFSSTPSAERWVRLFVYAPSSSALEAEIVELADTDRRHQIVFSLYDDGADVHSHGLTDDFVQSDNRAPVRDAWSCYELHVLSAATGVVELYRDGALVTSAAADTRPPAGDVLPRLIVGIASKTESREEDLFVDEIAADVERIGCE